ncbi:MAG: ABC transporter substrate-binding protein [Alphaproteobacteria bacterium]|nr:ABC transporter substrate-binding protein [Alphaproteobacteria bacterium]
MNMPASAEPRSIRFATGPRLGRLAAAGLAFCAGLFTLACETMAQPKLTVVISSTSFAWLPLYVADGAGYFRDESLNVEISNVKDGAVVVTAILSGNADIAGVGANAVFAARVRNQPVRLLTPMNSEYTSTIFGRKDVFGKKGITENSTLEQKIEAIKGMKVGVINFNSGQHLMFRFLMQRYGGADLDKVAEVVPVGDAGSTLAAMSRGLVDITAFSPPVPQRAVTEGYASVLLDPIRGDIPETRGMVFTAMATTEDTIAKRRTDLGAFVRAIDRANKLIYSDTPKAGEAARKYLATMQSDLYDSGLKALVPATPKSPEVSIAGLKAYYELLKIGGEKYAQGEFDFEASVANDLVREAMKGAR